MWWFIDVIERENKMLNEGMKNKRYTNIVKNKYMKIVPHCEF